MTMQMDDAKHQIIHIKLMSNHFVYIVCVFEFVTVKLMCTTTRFHFSNAGNVYGFDLGNVFNIQLKCNRKYVFSYSVHFQFCGSIKKVKSAFHSNHKMKRKISQLVELLVFHQWFFPYFFLLFVTRMIKCE